MKKNKIAALVTTLIFLILTGLSTNVIAKEDKSSIQFDYKEHNYERKIAKKFWEDYYKNPKDIDETKIGIHLQDINGDGNLEIITFLADYEKGYCGQGGCPFAIIKANKYNESTAYLWKTKNNDKQEQKFTTLKVLLAIKEHHPKILKSITNGYNDILLDRSEPSEKTIFKWDGSAYREN